jgi:hypothetical protein
MSKKRKIKLFIILAVLGLLFINMAIISGYFFINAYGNMKLNPGEEYTVNIPFKLFQSPVVSGKAVANNGTVIAGVNVTVTDSHNKILGEDITNENGEYSITLPKISDITEYYVDVGYNNGSQIFTNLANGSNDYDYTFDDMNYSKSQDNYIELTGKITNEDAEIENGRMVVTLNKCEDNTNNCDTVIDTKTEYVNIAPLKEYNIPNTDIKFRWPIDDLSVGKYQLEVSMSFNGVESNSLANYIYVTA